MQGLELFPPAPSTELSLDLEDLTGLLGSPTDLECLDINIENLGFLAPMPVPSTNPPPEVKHCLPLNLPPLETFRPPVETPSCLPPQPAEPAPTHEDRSSESCSEAEDDEACGKQDGKGAAGGAKRRRRTRDTRQQELNRLAQQRYRQRKKQKAQDLSSQVADLNREVDALTSQLQGLKAVEGEARSLRQDKARLEQQVAAQQAQLSEAAARISGQEAVIEAQRKQLAAHERALSAAAAQLAAQRDAQAAAAAGGSSLPALDKEGLEEHLTSLLHAVMRESLVDGGDGPASSAAAQSKMALLQEAISSAMQRTLNSSCWRELPAAHRRQGAGAAGEKAPAAITVSCC